MGIVLLLIWWTVIVVTIGSLILLALTVITGIVIAIGVAVSSLYWSLKEWRWQKHIPAWCDFLDDF